MSTLFKFSSTAATIFINFLKTNIILLQNPFWNEAVHTSLRWKTTRPAQHLFASHNSPCLLYSSTHHPRSVENKVGNFMNYILALGTLSKCSEQIRVTLMEQQCATCMVWNSAPNLEQRPGKNRSFLLPESGPQVASGKDRPHILSDPLWRWPCDITCCIKKLYGMPRQCVSRLQKATLGENRFEKSPGLEGSLKHRDGGKGLHFASQLTSRFNAAVTLKKVSIKKATSPWDFRLKSGKGGGKKHALGLKKQKHNKKLMSSQHGYHFFYEHRRKHELRSIFFFLPDCSSAVIEKGRCY